MGRSKTSGRATAGRPAGRHPSGIVDAVLGRSHAAERLALCRLITGAAVLRTVWHLPSGRFVADYKPMVEEADGRPAKGPALDPLVYEALRGVAAVSTGAWMLGARHPAVKIAANGSFALLQRQLVALDDDAYNYNSHLNVFLALLSLADEPGSAVAGAVTGAVAGTGAAVDAEYRADPEYTEYASAVLTALQAYYATMYLQSGISKLVKVGWRWTEGRTLRAAWAEVGTPAGKRLAAMDPGLAKAASTAALVYELAFAPLLVAAWRHKELLGLSSAAFHGAVKATMGISFWHLSWFSVPLFAAPDEAVRRCGRLLAAPRGNARARRGAAVAGALLGAAPLVRSWLRKRAGA
ncbi:hypothetical protein [Kitasatospora sp. NPDC093102]|uniref:hypothetical protein n=1 Tax=Kitasatospora sp. NPDC093102 TaxID=3155069 RepID=UPI0034355A85